MQKLNGREIYVLVLLAIVATVLTLLIARDLFSETSSLQMNEEGSLRISKENLINIGNTLLQIILCVAAFVFMLMKRRAGWIAAISLLGLYTFVSLYLLATSAMAGIIDIGFWLASGITLILLLSVIFLFVPSTLRKFKVNKKAIVPSLIVFVVLVLFYFVFPK